MKRSLMAVLSILYCREQMCLENLCRMVVFSIFGPLRQHRNIRRVSYHITEVVQIAQATPKSYEVNFWLFQKEKQLTVVKKY